MSKKDPAQGGLALWILIHTHRHGTTISPILSVEAVDVDEIAASDPETYELDRDDEFLEIEGPTPLLKLFTHPEFPPGNLSEIHQGLIDKGVTSRQLADLVDTYFATAAKAINDQGFDAQVNTLITAGLLKP